MILGYILVIFRLKYVIFWDTLIKMTYEYHDFMSIEIVHYFLCHFLIYPNFYYIGNLSPSDRETKKHEICRSKVHHLSKNGYFFSILKIVEKMYKFITLNTIFAKIIHVFSKKYVKISTIFHVCSVTIYRYVWFSWF